MLAKVEIRNISDTTTEVIVDGQDISDKISALTYQHCAGETPKLILELVPGTLDVLSNSCEVEEDPKKALLRRFIPIGTKEEMDKFNSLAEEKNLSRDDLAVILRAIKLNPAVDDRCSKLSRSEQAVFEALDTIK